MPGAAAALGFATRLDEIGFPEFTAKLVSDVFDALIAANIRQQQAFVELLEATSKTLTTFINDTKDDIGPEEILQFLAAAAPPADQHPGAEPTVIAEGENLSAEAATTLNEALEVADADIEDDNQVATSGVLTPERVDVIKEAVAKRIAASKYVLLSEMVRQGMLRLVVEDGTIETRLNFRAYGSDYFARHASSMTRNEFGFRAQAATGGLLSLWAKASASTSYNHVRVSTTTTTNTSNSTVDVQIYGGVRINFRTDYLPLNQE